MTDKEQKDIFSKNLKRYIEIYEKSQKEIADAIKVSPQTFNTWCQGIALPRMGKVEQLANYFNIMKSDLLDNKDNAEKIEDLEMERAISCITNNPAMRDFVVSYMKLSERQKDSVANLVIAMLTDSK